MLPTTNRSAGLARRVALLLVVSSVAGAAGGLWWSATQRSEIAFLPRRSPAEWIVYPSGPEGVLHPRLELSTVFRRAFKLDQVPSQATLRIAGLHWYTLSVNGTALGEQSSRESPVLPAIGTLTEASSGPDRNWKHPDSFEVSRQLRPGENQIEVTVFNTNGPPALWLALDTQALKLNSDESWQASYAGAAWRTARLATKPKTALMGSQLYGGEEPWANFRAQWWLLLLFAGLSAAICWVIRRLGVTADRWLALGLAALWVALFANNLSVLAPSLGFDVDGHVAYIRYVQEHQSLPLASEGWEMFQAPLYYLMSAALLKVLSLSVLQAGGVVALRVMGLGIGVAHFLVVWASLRLLFPGERSKQRWGVALAGCLPPLLYLSQYVTNEALGAAMVSACVYVTLRILKQDRASWKLCAGLGLCLGAALLAKSTAVLAVPVILGALVFKEVQRLESKVQGRGIAGGRQESEGGKHGLWDLGGRIGMVLAVCAAVGGWHYVRLWVHYGSPLIGVWDPRTGFVWWQEDGFRTGAFYLRFGEVLRHPWFSSFKSFGDGIYSTLWGDGLFGGGAGLISPPPWNYGLMAIGYWLALLPALAILAGSILAVVKFIRQPTAEWFLVSGLGFVVALAVLYLSLTVPYYCHVKAFYGLSALLPLCAVGAWGFDFLCRRIGRLQPVLWVVFGIWALNSYASFWISQSSVPTLLWRARCFFEKKEYPEATGVLRARLELEPQNAEVRSALADILTASGEGAEAVKQAEIAVRDKPNDASAHLVLGRALTQQKRNREAIEQTRRALELGPGYGLAYEDLATLLARQASYDEAIRVAREGLALSAFSPELRFALGSALVNRGEAAEALMQLRLAATLKPEWVEPHCLLGAILTKGGRLETTEAIAHYTEALRLEPDLAEALNNLAWIRAAHPRAEFRDGPEAVRLAERACRVTTNKEPMLIGTLAAAHAEAGRFEEAVATARKARELALTTGQQGLADKNQKLIELFSARHPYREPAQP